MYNCILLESLKVTYGCQPIRTCWELNPGPLQEQQIHTFFFFACSLAVGLVRSFSCRVEGWVMDLTSGLVWMLAAVSVPLRLGTSSAESPPEPKSFLNGPLRHHMRSEPVSDYWKSSIKIYFIIFWSVSLGLLLHVIIFICLSVYYCLSPIYQYCMYFVLLY